MNDKTILTIERIFLAIIGIIFMASGIFTFFDPHTMGQALGIAPMNASGETEIRATYGGLVVGSGLLVLAGLFSRLMAVALRSSMPLKNQYISKYSLCSQSVT